MTKTDLQKSQVRYEIAQAIEMLLAQPERSEEANRILRAFHHRFHEKEHILSLDSIVFGGLVHEALSSEAQREPSILSVLRDELMGHIPYRNTYALKHNFAELLYGDALEAYQKLKEIFAIVAGRVGTPMTLQDMSEEYKDLGESLYELCYEKLQTHTIAELLVAQGCHVLLTLPDDGSEYIDLKDPFYFSTIYSISGMEAVGPHLKYVESILQKLEGKAILFVDVHLLPRGFVINLR